MRGNYLVWRAKFLGWIEGTRHDGTFITVDKTAAII